MSPSSSRKWSAKAIATGDLDKIQASMAVAGDRVNDARRHIRSARTLAEDDPTLAMAACHDAIRKAITGHMAAFGLRTRAGEGAHRIVLEYARQELADLIDVETLDEADDIRRDRGLAEYAPLGVAVTQQERRTDDQRVIVRVAESQLRRDRLLRHRARAADARRSARCDARRLVDHPGRAGSG